MQDLSAELLDDLFIGTVKQLARQPGRVNTIGQELAQQLSPEEPPCPSGTPYWYTVCGCKGWKLQRQIVRDPLDNSKRRGTGICRILDLEDHPHAFGNEEDFFTALQNLMAASSTKHKRLVSDRAAAAAMAGTCHDSMSLFVHGEKRYGRALTSAAIDQSIKFSKVESWLATQPLIEGYDLIGAIPDHP